MHIGKKLMWRFKSCYPSDQISAISYQLYQILLFFMQMGRLRQKKLPNSLQSDLKYFFHQRKISYAKVKMYLIRKIGQLRKTTMEIF